MPVRRVPAASSAALGGRRVRAELALETAREHGHLLRRLLVAARLGDGYAAPIGIERCDRRVAVGEGAPEQLPCSGVVWIASDCFAEMRDRAREVAELQVFVAQRKAQERSVAGRADELLEIGDDRGGQGNLARDASDSRRRCWRACLGRGRRHGHPSYSSSSASRMPANTHRSCG
jgi:hypothetical protein